MLPAQIAPSAPSAAPQTTADVGGLALFSALINQANGLYEKAGNTVCLFPCFLLALDDGADADRQPAFFFFVVVVVVDAASG